MQRNFFFWGGGQVEVMVDVNDELGRVGGVRVGVNEELKFL